MASDGVEVLCAGHDTKRTTGLPIMPGQLGAFLQQAGRPGAYESMRPGQLKRGTEGPSLLRLEMAAR